ncbi:GNAT family N-acetyltransferase [bacterium D16-50]|nr:GNAT family N-acetyltransferase [bacterium D16-50]
MELICDYMKDGDLCRKLNHLTRKTFGFDFEGWVAGGYCEGDYIPYSFLENGRMVSNVSANRMHFMQKGVKRDYIQIGTVMTDQAYRRQGLARELMEHVIRRYEGRCDGIYLFADLGALDFYRGMGFAEGVQYRYRLKPEAWVRDASARPFLPVDSKDGQIRQRYTDAVRKSVVNSALEQVNKFGLQMFYTADLSNVYYADDIDCFAVLENEGDRCFLQSIVCKKYLSMKDILPRIRGEQSGLLLGFTPCGEDCGLFEAELFDGGDDYRLFYRGKALEDMEKEKLYFPQLSHA